MAGFKIGQRIRVCSSHVMGPPYDPKDVYVVSSIDPNDSTLKAKDESGRERGWVRWCDCSIEAPPTLWSLIAADLPEDVMLFLACFDGIGGIELKERVMDAILAKVPDLPARLVAYARTESGAAIIATNMPPKATQPQDGASP